MGFFNSIPAVSVAEAAQKLKDEGSVLLDVRSPEEYASGHARGASNCPLPSLRNCVNKLKGAAEVYVICQSGGRSSAAVSVLRSLNIPAVNVAGGTSAWRSAGLPLS